MRSGGKRTSMPFLCFICALIMGMCLGTVPADSFLECADFLSADEEIPSRSCSIRSWGKAAPDPQVFERRSQYETALALRQAARRHSVRTGRSFCAVTVTPDIFSLNIPCVLSFCSHGFFQESASHTAIIGYIHRQDGQKPHSPFFS